MPEPSRAIVALMAAGEPADVIPRLVGRPAWMDSGLCRSHPGSWWFSGGRAERACAVEVCGRCAVKVQCLAFALDLSGRSRVVGIWGGTDEGERRRMEGRRPRSCAT